uniref:HPS5-like beta-propeller domain-containing protein n=1 Tax=Mola mola TaxID=94237 RepID=A0A3Q3VJN7_MOLML
MPLIPAVPENHSHVLAEFDCLDPLLSALRLDSGRLKCTCLAVSRKWLALGTSAGGLHLIQREGWKQKLILTHKEGSITQVACCPHDEDFLAVATSQGMVVVWELQLERRGRPERVSVSCEHRGQAITALCWDTSTLRVFVGDSGGRRPGGILTRCPNHLNWLLSTRRSSGSTLSSSRMSVLLTLSLRLSPATLRRKLISAACIRDLILSVTTQSS